ncbi:uncharacterized protein C16orf78 homolog isoform X3 [Meriones unguiculatus]|uniref:uncharacterized protein C16orf78 homolog isoform X3 n=1 Tax=Meriones unguiculatus TaxID=10047 RepID=UPI00293E627E|nr:uncharacterized protein C16orf78 homolog isoform X3 [Meriones unguiculatus]
MPVPMLSPFQSGTQDCGIVSFRKKAEEASRANEKIGKKTPAPRKKPDRPGHKVTFHKTLVPRMVKKKDVSAYHKGPDLKVKRTSLTSSSFSRDTLKKSGTPGSRRGSEITELDIKDVIALETNTRVSPFRRQSSVDPILQETMFGNRRVGLWANKAPENPYERKLKSLMEKGTEPKIESSKMLKPEEVLSCRYLRLSKNNIKTLIKLCKDAGMDVDIHPHMVESDIDSKTIFKNQHAVSL